MGSPWNLYSVLQPSSFAFCWDSCSLLTGTQFRGTWKIWSKLFVDLRAYSLAPSLLKCPPSLSCCSGYPKLCLLTLPATSSLAFCQGSSCPGGGFGVSPGQSQMTVNLTQLQFFTLRDQLPSRHDYLWSPSSAFTLLFLLCCTEFIIIICGKHSLLYVTLPLRRNRTTK